MIWFEAALLPDGWREGVRVGMKDGLITTIEIATRPATADEVYACGLPGLSNLHSHVFQFAMAGLTERPGRLGDDFWSWREMMYRFVDRLEPHHLEAIAGQAYAAMLEAGFTRVGEFHYLHRDREGRFYANKAAMAEAIGAAAGETGIGLTLLPVLYSHANFGGQAPGPGQRRFVNDLDDYASLLDATRRALRCLEGSRIGIAPHSLRAVAPDQLRAIVAAAGREPIHIHVAEQMREVADCLEWSGRRPVELLFDSVPIDDRWCLVHATQTSDAELRQIADSGAVVGLCPITEANLGDGIFEAYRYRDLGGRYGIGSDSNVCISANRELSLLEYSQRLSLRKRNVMSTPGRSTGRGLYDAVLLGGHQATGAPSAGIAPGAPADLVSLRPARPGQATIFGDGVLDSWVFATGVYAVETVWSGGRKRVAEGRHLEHERFAARYDQTMRELMAS